MKNQCHILNGDALKEQFPKSIQGELIIARECLVDGNAEANNLPELYHSRAHFISEEYGGYSHQDYYDNTVSEFEKIQNIAADTAINLWFEDDLFCQVNLWFVIHLVYEKHKNQSVFLVRPKSGSEYSFGSMDKEELRIAFQNKLKIEPAEIELLAKLWKFYQQNDGVEMMRIAEKLKARFPFLVHAVQAHMDRLPQNGNSGRPIQSLIQIMDELNTTEFGPIFRAFSKREAIYGFGDLQVKRMLDKIKNTSAGANL